MGSEVTSERERRHSCTYGAYAHLAGKSDKGAAIRKQHGIKRNEIELFVVRLVDLESVIQSEVSQKEKNKYCMLTHIYGI